MKIVQINSTCGVGSTGKICVDISKLLSLSDVENYIIYSLNKSDYPLGLKYNNYFTIKIGALCSRIFGNYGFNSILPTLRLIRKVRNIKPDIVHIHNIHSHDCNLSMLFSFFKKNNIKIIWTFHDCWAFTAYCPHFDFVGCNNWKTQCRKCPQKKYFSWFFDNSKWLFKKKKEILSKTNFTIVTPSNWLASMVGKSFLKDHPIKVINNGIDLSAFKPISSNIKQKYNIPDNKKIVLGVAFDWGVRKGLDVFIELSKRFSEDYQIVLVGVDNKTAKQLPDNIVAIPRTKDKEELAMLYSVADVFVNPTREENFPTVNIEALACGTPVVTFNTGGSPEILDNTCGVVVPKDDVGALISAIEKVCVEHPFTEADCISRASIFDKDSKFKEYINLYNEVMND